MFLQFFFNDSVHVFWALCRKLGYKTAKLGEMDVFLSSFETMDEKLGARDSMIALRMHHIIMCMWMFT